MNEFSISGQVERFPGENGWYYVALNEGLSKDLRPLLKNTWPALLNAEFKINNTSWQSSLMPIKDGPLFVALPVKIRKTENINTGDQVRISVKIKN